MQQSQEVYLGLRVSTLCLQETVYNTITPHQKKVGFQVLSGYKRFLMQIC